MEGLEFGEFLRGFGWRRSGGAVALQAQVPALEPHSPAEHLDDLRPLPHAYVHEAHGADPPRIPTGDEPPRPDHDIHRGVFPVHIGEEG